VLSLVGWHWYYLVHPSASSFFPLLFWAGVVAVDSAVLFFFFFNIIKEKRQNEQQLPDPDACPNDSEEGRNKKRTCHF